MAELKVKIDLTDDAVTKIAEALLSYGDLQFVTRCADCKYFSEGMSIGMCKRVPDKPIIPMPYNNYCGFGKRKQEKK